MLDDGTRGACSDKGGLCFPLMSHFPSPFENHLRENQSHRTCQKRVQLTGISKCCLIPAQTRRSPYPHQKWLPPPEAPLPSFRPAASEVRPHPTPSRHPHAGSTPSGSGPPPGGPAQGRLPQLGWLLPPSPHLQVTLHTCQINPHKDSLALPLRTSEALPSTPVAKLLSWHPQARHGPSTTGLDTHTCKGTCSQPSGLFTPSCPPPPSSFHSEHSPSSDHTNAAHHRASAVSPQPTGEAFFRWTATAGLSLCASYSRSHGNCISYTVTVLLKTRESQEAADSRTA